MAVGWWEIAYQDQSLNRLLLKKGKALCFPNVDSNMLTDLESIRGHFAVKEIAEMKEGRGEKV